MAKILNRALKITGEPRVIDGWKVQILRYNYLDQIMELACKGTPVDGVKGVQPAGIAYDMINSLIYRNDGNSTATEWVEIADGAKGETGPEGPTGPTGPEGPTGA